MILMMMTWKVILILMRWDGGDIDNDDDQVR